MSIDPDGAFGQDVGDGLDGIRTWGRNVSAWVRIEKMEGAAMQSEKRNDSDPFGTFANGEWRYMHEKNNKR